MILPEEEATKRVCILRMQSTDASMGMRPMPTPMRMGTNYFCLGAVCVAYWRWANPEHTLGYCSITGKPEF